MLIIGLPSAMWDQTEQKRTGLCKDLGFPGWHEWYAMWGAIIDDG